MVYVLDALGAGGGCVCQTKNKMTASSYQAAVVSPSEQQHRKSFFYHSILSTMGVGQRQPTVIMFEDYLGAIDSVKSYAYESFYQPTGLLSLHPITAI